MKEMGHKLSQFSVTAQPVIGVLNLLIAYFGESESVLFRGFEVTLYYCLDKKCNVLLLQFS
jgi:hypothetical protein